MNDLCNRFYFAKDMNGDMRFTVTDLQLMVEFFWLLPAKIVVWIFSNPKLATFFEIDCFTGTSWGGGIFSLFAWYIVFIIVVSGFEESGQKS